MAQPSAGIFATAIYTEVFPLTYADEQYGWHLLYYLDAIGQMFDEIEGLARDTDDAVGWSKLLDPVNTPAKALPWLAQFVGVELAPTLSEADKRNYIKEAVNWKRGTVAAIINTTQFFLTGSKTVRLDERDSSPYHYTITINPAEVTNLSLVQAALNAQKPAGLQFTLNLTTTRTYFQVKTDNATYSAAKSAYANYGVMRGG